MGLRGMKVAERPRVWSPTWSEIMGVGGFHPSAAHRGAYVGLVHSIASHSKPQTPAKLAAEGAPHPHPPKPRDAFTKALGAIRPTLDTQCTVCCVRSRVAIAKRSSVNQAKR